MLTVIIETGGCEGWSEIWSPTPGDNIL
jgi:hypothetical protein